MSGKKHATSEKAGLLAEGSHQKLAKAFLASLDRSRQQHGPQVLEFSASARFGGANEIDRAEPCAARDGG
jgi:hypothetical protein